MVPFDGGVVHLVDEDDEFVDAGSFGQHGVFLRLTAAFESRFELAPSARPKRGMRVSIIRQSGLGDSMGDDDGRWWRW